MKEYEIQASPQAKTHDVKVLVIEAKREDARQFFQKLPRWDSDFLVFQDAPVVADAVWVEPFDIQNIQQQEGDYWKLRIVIHQALDDLR